MKCDLCGIEYDEKAAASCKGCPMAGACHMTRCPNCGYETPADTKLVKVLKGWRNRLNAARRKG